ncbi:MAG TPA: PilZ domain-containing protein [Blastocatellia bacterium]|nr:PilZ domain-containing protein [Blastocatellia bacterium]
MNSLSINSSTMLAEPKCRMKPRLYHPFPIKVQGIDSNGQEFTLETALDNISAGGLYFRLPHSVEIGDHLTIIIRMSSATAGPDSGMQIAAYSTILRVEELLTGEYGIAVAFNHHRIL